MPTWFLISVTLWVSVTSDCRANSGDLFPRPVPTRPHHHLGKERPYVHVGRPGRAVIGVDTHHDTHTASIVTPLGAELGHLQTPADAAGYAALLDFARSLAPGPRIAWALEGTRSHGAGLTRALQDCGEQVIEVDRPKRLVRKHGKSDPIDATRAAREALTQQHLAQPRADGTREQLRVLLVARDHHARMRTATINTFKASCSPPQNRCEPSSVTWAPPPKSLSRRAGHHRPTS